MNIAICFFGHVKNFNDQLYKSFVEYILTPIKNTNNIDYHLVTYNNKVYYNPSSGENDPINCLSIKKYFVFQTKIILDINANYTKNNNEFVKSTLKKCGYTGYWGSNSETSTIYSIRQLYGLDRLYNSLQKNNKYDKYILCRPDCIFENKLQEYLLTEDYNICIPNFNHWYGYNDRFAVVDFEGLKTYCSRYKRLITSPEMYHSETYLKSTIKKSNNTLHLFNNFRFRLLRANGQLSRPDY